MRTNTQFTYKDTHDAYNNSCQLHRSQKERCLRFIQEKVQSCARLFGDKELMIRRVQFIRRTKEAATQVACAGNTRGYHSEYGSMVQ